MAAADELAKQAAEAPTIDATIIGTFVAQDGALAVVDVGAARLFDVPNIGSTVPYPGQLVRLLRVNKQTFLWGPAIPGWPIGQVVSFASPIAVVEFPPASGVTKELGTPVGMTLAPGDYVLIDWASGGLVVQQYAVGALPENVAPDDPSPAGGGSGHQIFTALDTGSYSGGWWTNQVYDSTSNTGAAFYGSKIADTIPDTATITSIAVFLPKLSESGDPPKLRAHTSSGKPGGNVAFTGPAYTLPARNGWVGVPTSLGDLLKANAFGVGFEANTGGYNRFKGTAEDGQSMALDIAWEA